MVHRIVSEIVKPISPTNSELPSSIAHPKWIRALALAKASNQILELSLMRSLIGIIKKKKINRGIRVLISSRREL